LFDSALDLGDDKIRITNRGISPNTF